MDRHVLQEDCAEGCCLGWQMQCLARLERGEVYVSLGAGLRIVMIAKAGKAGSNQVSTFGARLQSGMGGYRVRDADVVSEIIDGEAIIMDLTSGIYFSALGVGAVIWDGIAGGFDEDDIKSRICAGFAVAPPVLAADFEAYIAVALANGLIRPDAGALAVPPRWTLALPALVQDYAPPVLHRYGDMEDLALLDPIHDVAEAEGWPAPKDDIGAAGRRPGEVNRPGPEASD